MPDEIKKPEETPTEPTTPPAQEPTPAGTSTPQKPDPFADPVVAAEIQKLQGQISTLSKESKSAKELQKQLTDAQQKITEYENAQLTETQKKEKEYQDAIAAKEAANNAKAQTELENIKLRAFIGSGLKPEFLRFVQGTTEEEVKESIADLQKLIAESAPAPTTPVATPTVPPAQPQPTSPVTQPPAPTKHTFTYAEIASMSPAEYAKNRDAILQAAAHNEIK